jgi:predicted nucleic-acid-binding protein
MLDTNVLLDWLLNRDATRTAQIDRLLNRLTELQIPDVAIIELAYALEKLYKLPRDLVKSNILIVLDEPIFNCNRTMFNRALGEYSDYPALSFVDCCLLHYAQLQNALPLWTSDKKLVRQGSGVAKMLG